MCPRCRSENPPGARFCNSCGHRLDATCAACGHANPPGSKFCNGCGGGLGAADPKTATHFGSPDTYTPKHLADRILTSKAALEGERKVVTVLFADLKGSMELLADRDPEEARTILARLHRQQGRDDGARRALADVYGWFTEGLATADLVAAKELLTR
jgi:hypothetical protein